MHFGTFARRCSVPSVDLGGIKGQQCGPAPLSLFYLFRLLHLNIIKVLPLSSRHVIIAQSLSKGTQTTLKPARPYSRLDAFLKAPKGSMYHHTTHIPPKAESGQHHEASSMFSCFRDDLEGPMIEVLGPNYYAYLGTLDQHALLIGPSGYRYLNPKYPQ